MLMNKNMGKPVSVIVVGAGDRAGIYTRVAEESPDMMRVVGVVEPDKKRREHMKKRFSIPESECFSDVSELVARGKSADAIINCTMDQVHVATSLPLLGQGYAMLIEKPFATNEDELKALVGCARRNASRVMVCHELRYSEFYGTIKQRLMSGEIGDIINIQTAEHVSYHHIATAFVRGKWANSERSHTSMLLAKCCHDLDLIMWLMGDDSPVSVTSFGSRQQFKPENAPEGATDRCLAGCPYVDSCPYSAKRLYLDTLWRWANYVWAPFIDKPDVTMDERISLLRESSPYGRCVYKCDNNVVDHQSVLIRFASGATVTHNMVGGASRPLRPIHIIGTKGEIYGNFEEQKFFVSLIDPSRDALDDERRVECVDLGGGEHSGHGGGDLALARDFVRFVRGEETSPACTYLEDSVKSHLCIYRADESMNSGGQPQPITL